MMSNPLLTQPVLQTTLCIGEVSESIIKHAFVIFLMLRSDVLYDIALVPHQELLLLLLLK